MTKRTLLWVIFCLFLSCGVEGKKEIIKTKKIISINENINMNINNASFIDDKIYIMKSNKSEISIKIYNSNMSYIKSYKINRGKGPGEILYPYKMKLNSEYIYIYDGARNIITIYRRNSFKYYKELILSKKIDRFSSFDISKKYIFFFGRRKNKILKYNIKKEKVIKKLKYKKELSLKKSWKELEGKKVRNGIIKIDKKRKMIYLGYYCKPFKIEVYDFELNKIGEKIKELPYDNIEKRQFTHRGIEGSILINSLDLYSNKVFSCYGGGLKIGKKKMTPIISPFWISVYDRSVNKLKLHRLEKMKKISGLARILNVSKNKIILIVFNTKDKFISKKIAKKNNNYLYILNNPINNEQKNN